MPHPAAPALELVSTNPDANVRRIWSDAFGTVRSDLQALIDHAGSGSSLRPIPVRPAEVALRALELARVSPLAEWHYKTAHRDSFVDVSKAQREHILRKQMESIQRELGDVEPEQVESRELREKLDATAFSEEGRKEALRELARLDRTPSISP